MFTFKGDFPDLDHRVRILPDYIQQRRFQHLAFFDAQRWISISHTVLDVVPFKEASAAAVALAGHTDITQIGYR